MEWDTNKKFEMFSKCKLRVGYIHFVHWNEFKQSRLKSNDTVCLIWWSAFVQPKEYDIRWWETVRIMDARICLMDLIFTFSRYIWSVCYSKRQKVTSKICVTQLCMYNWLCRTLRVNATKTKDQKEPKKTHKHYGKVIQRKRGGEKWMNVNSSVDICFNGFVYSFNLFSWSNRIKNGTARKFRRYRWSMFG